MASLKKKLNLWTTTGTSKTKSNISYEYMSSFEGFDKILLYKKDFHCHLKDDHISDEDCVHVMKV